MVGRGRNLWTLAAVILAAGVCRAGDDGRVGGSDERLSDRIIVRVQAAASVEAFCNAFATAHPGLTLEPLDRIAGREIHLLKLEPPGLDEDLLDQIEDELEEGAAYSNLLQWGEFAYEGDTAEGRTGSFWLSIENGERFDSQFAAGQLDLERAHDRAQGAGVLVGLLDTGVDRWHPALEGRVAPGGIDLIDGDDDPGDVGDGVDNDADGALDEMVGHGTFMASLIRLTAPDAMILAVRVLDGDGRGSSWLVAKGMYAAVEAGAHVINASLGTTWPSRAVADAVADARSRGVVVVAAAGNQGTDQVPEYPAATPSAIGVASVNDLDVAAPFTNYGTMVGITAPGTRVLIPGGPLQADLDRSVIGALPDGAWAVWEGTSVSTAFVSGAAAMLRGLMPSAVGDLTTAELIEQRLRLSAVDITANNRELKGLLGAGRLSAGAAVRLGTGDLNVDGVVNGLDLEMIQDAWDCNRCLADLDGNGDVDLRDFFVLLSNWG